VRSNRGLPGGRGGGDEQDARLRPIRPFICCGGTFKLIASPLVNRPDTALLITALLQTASMSEVIPIGSHWHDQMAGSHWWNDQGVIELDPLRSQFDLNLIHLIVDCQLPIANCHCQLPELQRQDPQITAPPSERRGGPGTRHSARWKQISR
jgi:hypothetical protein